MTTTETISPHSFGLDAEDDEAIVAAFTEGQVRAVTAVASARPAIVSAARAIVSRLAAGSGRIIYVGAGSSGLIAALDGMELAGTFGWPEARTLFILANGHVLAPGLPGGTEDDGERGRAEMVLHAPSPADAVIAVAASGTTPFTLSATAAAREAGALTVGLASNAAAPLLARVDQPVFLDTGPEVIGGSTRMGAGTAQKAALGILSSLVMIRLGRVHDGLMVDLRIDNEKLRRRAVAIVMQIAGCGAEAAAAALEAAGDSVKLAVLVARGATPARARDLVAAADGNLRKALALLQDAGAAQTRAGAPPVA
jgi:N-acetylmuramic acid 6-phosphate etherase